MDEQALISAYKKAGFSIWESGGGEAIYGYRSGFRRFQVTNTMGRDLPVDWEEPVVLQYLHEKDFTAWRKQFPSSQAFFDYWYSGEAQR